MHAPPSNGLFSVPASLDDLFSEAFFCAIVMTTYFDAQGHRGARGLQPENTLASFETALDYGMTAIETDVHLTRDNVPLLSHDPYISERLCSLLPGRTAPEPAGHPAVRSLSLEQLRCYRADRNPDPARFPEQKTDVPPLTRALADAWNMHPYVIPTLADLIRFVEEYAGEQGRALGKTEQQRAGAGRLRFDLELKRQPFRPETIGDGFDGTNPGVLERRVVEVVTQAGVVDRTIVRSFDHRCVRAIRQLEPGLTTAVLIAGTAPIHPAALVRDADAQIYCPEFLYLRQEDVAECHAEGVRVVPWTVNETEDVKRLQEWNVDGMTTDYPDRLRNVLNASAALR